jgi:tetratricopeptide (TPR) repeat protein
MKRYLTVGIVFGILVVIIVAISWLVFPSWKNPASGGFWTLLGLTIVGVFTFVKDLVSIWKDLKEEKKEEPKPSSPAPMQSINSQKADSIINAPGGTINVYPPRSSEPIPEVPSFWHIPHPYPMPPNFTGRATEQTMLDDWLAEEKDRLFIFRALGGFGKSALAWQWINTHVNPAEWTKLVWWSFYEGDASFDHFIEETLKYLKFEIPQGQRPQVDALLKAMQGQKILLIMDGFERALRAYSSMNAAYQGDEEPKLEDNQIDCVNINAEIFLKSVCSLPSMKSKALMTTRLTPRAVKPRGEFLQGCREEELTAMQKEDAVEFFRKQKIKGTHAEIEAACSPYGYHPLSLRLLAGRILKDFENPADIVVAQRLKIDGDLKAYQHHVLEVSYNSLPPHEQKLLSMISCFRSPVEIKTLEAIEVRATGQSPQQDDLRDLVDRGLLHFNEKNGKFDLHPIVRRYAYFQMNDLEQKNIHEKLAIYVVEYLPPAVINIPSIEYLAPIIELYYHMVRSQQFDLALDIYQIRLARALYFQFGSYQTIIELLHELFPNSENELPQLKKSSNRGWVLNELANAYSSNGQLHRAISACKNAIPFAENKRDIARVTGNLAIYQLEIGSIQDAECNLVYRIDLCRETRNKYDEGIGHTDLGRLLSYIGLWDKANAEFSCAIELFDPIRDIEMTGLVWAYRALYFSLVAHSDLSPQNDAQRSAVECALHSLEILEEAKQIKFSFEMHFIQTHWLLGAAYRLNRQFNLAENHLNEAIMRNRIINEVETEADILLDLARLRYEQKKYEEAKSLAEEALSITERCGYVLQGADVNLFLAQYALEQENDKVKAKEYAEYALKLATCDGPPYYYKVAYEESERMLERLKK